MNVFLKRICTKELALGGDVLTNSSGFVDPTKRCQLVLLRSRVQDVLHLDSPGDNGVGDE